MLVVQKAHEGPGKVACRAGVCRDPSVDPALERRPDLHAEGTRGRLWQRGARLLQVQQPKQEREAAAGRIAVHRLLAEQDLSSPPGRSGSGRVVASGAPCATKPREERLSERGG